MSEFRIERRNTFLFRWRVVGDGLLGLGVVWTTTFLTRRGAERFIRRHTWSEEGTR